MGRSFLMVLLIIMLGITIGMAYFWSTRAEGATAEEKAKAMSVKKEDIIKAAGEYGQTSCDSNAAYEYLKGRSSGHGWKIKPKVGGHGGLDPEFACRLAAFFKAGGCSNIFSAYRGKEDTLRACGTLNGRKGCNAHGNSCHNYGLAVDAGGCSQKDKTLAKKFGLHFPYNNSHIQCIHIKSPRCSKDTPPCAKGWKLPDPGEYNSASPPGSTPQNIAEQLGQGMPNIPGSPSGGSPGSPGGGNINTPSDIYNPEEYGGDAGEREEEEDEFHLDESPPAFDDLLGEFGEFGEDEETRELVGLEGEQRDNKVERFENATDEDVVSPPYVNAGVSNRCAGGALSKDIYGNITCSGGSTAQNTNSTLGSIGEAAVDEVGFFFEKFSESGPVAKTLTTFVESLVPIRHLGTDAVDTNDGYTFDRSSAYDVYIPNETVAYGQSTRAPLQEKDIVAWMVQEDIVEKNNPVQKVAATVSLKFAKPATQHISSSLFGLGGSYATSAFLNIANNI